MNVVVAGTSHQMFKSFITLQSGDSLTNFKKNNCANSSGDKKYNGAFRVVYFFFLNMRKKL